MSELKKLFEMVTNKTEPDLDSWQQQEHRQRRTGRNRKLGAILVAAALAVAIVGWAVLAGPDRGSTPATQPNGVPPTALEPDVQDVAVVTLDGIPVKGIPGLPADAALLDLSPDASTIAFVTSDGGTGTQIATIGVDGTGMKVITSGVPSYGDPVWSPDGTQIAFVWAPHSQADLYVMNADGSNVRRITAEATEQIEPQWSPDGTTLVYVDMGKDDQVDPQFSATADIWTVPSNGGTPTRLTTEDGPDAYPDYSPDGTEIVYARDNALMTIGVATGKDPHRLHATVGFPFSPRWSPDGARVAYGVWDPSYRPTVPFNGESYEAPLLIVNVLDVVKDRTTSVGDVGTIYDINPPVWWSHDQLMIRRVGH